MPRNVDDVHALVLNACETYRSNCLPSLKMSGSDPVEGVVDEKIVIVARSPGSTVNCEPLLPLTSVAERICFVHDVTPLGPRAGSLPIRGAYSMNNTRRPCSSTYRDGSAQSVSDPEGSPLTLTLTLSDVPVSRL